MIIFILLFGYDSLTFSEDFSLDFYFIVFFCVCVCMLNKKNSSTRSKAPEQQPNKTQERVKIK